MSPRVAAISDDLSSDFRDAVEIALELGLDGLAVRHIGGINIADLDPDTVSAIGRIATSNGLTISAITSPLGRDVSLDNDDAQSINLLKRMLQYADILNTPLIRIFAPWVIGKDPLPQWWDRPTSSQRLERTAHRLRQYAQLAESAGKTLMLELEGASQVGQVAEAAIVIEKVNSPALALCWDVCNGWWSGENPWEQGWPLAQHLPIVDVQAKDVLATPDDSSKPAFDQVRLGEGVIPYQLIIGALLDINYDGWFTAERVYHPRKPELEQHLQADIRADITALQHLVTRPTSHI